MEEDIKRKTTIWLHPGMIQRMDCWLEADNCKSRSEFVEKALRFYMGYLSTEDTSDFLSKALVKTMRGIVQENTHRICKMLFKLCVEIGVALNVVAAHFGAKQRDVEKLRGFVVGEVKGTNGCISFDSALDQQQNRQDTDEDEEWQE